MEKNVYPHVPELPGVPDGPPSYSQAFNARPSAPATEFPEMSSIPMQSQQQQQVIVQHVPLPPLGPRPCRVICPNCQQQQMSVIRYETATKTHLFAALICLLGLFCCACIPYCVDSCKNPNHYCSNCDAYLGMYNK